MTGAKSVTGPQSAAIGSQIVSNPATGTVVEGTIERGASPAPGSSDAYSTDGRTVGALSNEPPQPGAVSAQTMRARASRILPNGIPGKPANFYATCPMIGSLIAAKLLDIDAKGNVDLKQLFNVMTDYLGISPERAGVTVATSVIGNHFKDLPAVAEGKLNIFELTGSFLDHQRHGDTGVIRDNAFHEDRFQELVAHSSDGVTMTEADFASAIRAQLKRDASIDTATRGLSEDVFEAGAIINTIGYTDRSGVRRIDIDVLRDFYQNRRLPPKEEMMGRHPTGVLGHLATMGRIDIALAKEEVEHAVIAAEGAVEHAFNSVKDAIEGRSSGKPQSALLKLCPYMARSQKADQGGSNH